MSRCRTAITLALIATLGCQAPEDRALQHLVAGDGHLAKGALRDARLEYETAIELAPELIPARMRYVALLVAEERYEEALVRIRRLAGDAPASSQAVGLLARDRRQGRIREDRLVRVDRRRNVVVGQPESVGQKVFDLLRRRLGDAPDHGVERFAFFER